MKAIEARMIAKDNGVTYNKIKAILHNVKQEAFRGGGYIIWHGELTDSELRGIGDLGYAIDIISKMMDPNVKYKIRWQ